MKKFIDHREVSRLGGKSKSAKKIAAVRKNAKKARAAIRKKAHDFIEVETIATAVSGRPST